MSTACAFLLRQISFSSFIVPPRWLPHAVHKHTVCLDQHSNVNRFLFSSPLLVHDSGEVLLLVSRPYYTSQKFECESRDPTLRFFFRPSFRPVFRLHRICLTSPYDQIERFFFPPIFPALLRIFARYGPSLHVFSSLRFTPTSSRKLRMLQRFDLSSGEVRSEGVPRIEIAIPLGPHESCNSPAVCSTDWLSGLRIQARYVVQACGGLVPTRRHVGGEHSPTSEGNSPISSVAP